MNEARVYADGFERSFAEVKDLLEFLAERGRNAKWIRKPTNTLRLAPLEKEAQNLDAADASMEEILEDTEKNTQLVLKMRGESYPVRDCAIRTILSRAGVNGDGLRKLDKATYAKVVNYCLRVAKGDALIKIADGKVSAVHGGDKHDYCILDMKAMFETTCEYLNLNFKGSVYMEGSGIYDHSIVCGGVAYGMSGKCVVVCVWRRSQRAELVSGRLPLVYYRCGDSGRDAVL